MASASVLGIFAHVDTTVEAIRQLRQKGFSDLTVYTPTPVEDIEQEVERTHPLSRVRLFTLIGALTGTATGFFLTIWSSLIWSLLTGGKDPVSYPPFIVIVFELTILFGGLATVLAIFVLGRLPKLTPSRAYDPRFTLDRFGVAVSCPPEKAEAARTVMSSAGAEEVRQ